MIESRKKEPKTENREPGTDGQMGRYKRPEIRASRGVQRPSYKAITISIFISALSPLLLLLLMLKRQALEMPLCTPLMCGTDPYK